MDTASIAIFVTAASALIVAIGNQVSAHQDRKLAFLDRANAARERAEAGLSRAAQSEAIDAVKAEVVTGNGNVIGAIIQSGEARRIKSDVPAADRTDDERLQVEEQRQKEAVEQAAPRAAANELHAPAPRDI